MKNRIALSSVIIFFLVSCQIYPIRIINHKEPDLRVDFSVFQNAGCDPNGYGSYDCDEKSQLFEIGCNSISLDDLLGGFTPEYPIVRCENFVSNEIDFEFSPTDCLTEAVFQSGTYCERLVVFKDSNYLIVNNLSELQNIFAPVSLEEEALGFALVSTKNYAEYGQTYKNKLFYYVQNLEDTHVDPVDDGYLVHLFYTRGPGCGPFDTEAVDLKVTFEGLVDEISRTPVYRDPSQDNICVD